MPEPNIPARKINKEFLAGLEVVSNKVYPLAGATFERRQDRDPRLSKLHAMTGVPRSSKVCLYEHIATVRDKTSGKFFIAFRQTMDCLLEEFKDPKKYPKWLIESDAKRAELKIYIYAVRERDGHPVLPRSLPIIKTHEDYLEHIALDWVFDTLMYYLLQNNVITLDMFTRMS